MNKKVAKRDILIGELLEELARGINSPRAYSGYRCNEVHLNQLSRLDRFLPRRFYCTS